MSPTPAIAPSIRRRLLLFLLPPLVVLMLVNVYVSFRASMLFVQKAQQERLGDVAQFILASTWLMNFIQLDVTLLVVSLGVYFGLRPLLSLRRQIEASSPLDLEHLDATAVPAEVKPLVDALNALFDILAEAARSQRRFVADTAHQLRTPIAGLAGNLELLMQDPRAAELKDRLQALHEGMTRLGHSANQLLALARADPSASLATQFEAVDLKPLVERLVERNFDRAANGGLDLGAEAAAAQVRGAPRLLEDLLGNLLDNALSYTPGPGTVTVRSGVAADRPYVEVEDDGPGIPEGERVRVRERFYRLPGSAGHGTGLGLAIVDEIAAAHGAQLYIESAAGGRGTRARVIFPADITPLTGRISQGRGRLPKRPARSAGQGRGRAAGGKSVNRVPV